MELVRLGTQEDVTHVDHWDALWFVARSHHRKRHEKIWHVHFFPLFVLGRLKRSQFQASYYIVVCINGGLHCQGEWESDINRANPTWHTPFQWFRNDWDNSISLRLLTPPMETPDPPNDTPGALKQVVLTPQDIPWSLRVAGIRERHPHFGVSVQHFHRT